MKPTRPLAIRLAALEGSHRPPEPPSPLAWLNGHELDVLEQRAAAGDEQGARELLAQAERRAAAGAPPWSESATGRAADELERRIYWDELIPPALRSGGAVDYYALHREARRLAAERIAQRAP